MCKTCFSRAAYFLAILAALSGATAELGDVPAGGFRSPEGDARFSEAQGAADIMLRNWADRLRKALDAARAAEPAAAPAAPAAPATPAAPAAPAAGATTAG